jgi:predicted pyridoxine 5'-phosphate oxidase superfamily flavin-nucleotide-binding protein
MISKKLKEFIEKSPFAFVASADQRSRPHLAAAEHLKVPDPHHIVFDSWVCPKTLENVIEVPRLALAVVDPATARGYQLECFVESAVEAAATHSTRSTMPLQQIHARIVVRVEEILEFAPGPHSDHPLGIEA